MAKAKEPAKETWVETLQDNDFADAEPEVANVASELAEDVQANIASIRATRAKERAARGPVTKRRRVTNYHDAERLLALVKAGHTHLATANEIVDWEEAGLLPDPSHYYNGATPGNASLQGQIVPPAPADPEAT
jgi:hypothetical protein